LRGDQKKRSLELISPVSLTKVYDEKANACQNDLTPDRFNATGGIISSKETIVLEKGAKKEVIFDLNKVCWKETKSSVWANQELSSLVKPGRYTLSLSGSFDTGKITETPDYYDRHSIRATRTDDIEIEIK
jgi:hypothetical protein